MASGGLKQGTTVALQSCEQYDIETDTWRVLPSMQTARASHAAVVKNGAVYVFGGFANGIHLDTIERLSGEKWDVVSTQTKFSARTAPGAIFIDDKRVVIFGGWDGKNYLSDVYVFDTTIMAIAMVNENTGVGICPEYYPTYCDKSKIVFGNYVNHTLYSMELLSYSVKLFSKPTFQ